MVVAAVFATPDKLTLAGHLSALYANRHQLRGRRETESDFVDALKADPELLASARQRRAALVDTVTKKCYVSRVHRDILDAALAKMESP